MATQRRSDTPSTSPLDDPRLTAYALGELADADRADLAGDLDRDPALAAEVAAVRAMADDLAVAFFLEAAAPTGGLTERQRFAVRNAARRAASRWRLAFIDGPRARPILAALAVAATVFVLFSPAVGSTALTARLWVAKVRDGSNITQLDNRDIGTMMRSEAGDRPTLWSMMTGGRSARGPVAMTGAAEERASDEHPVYDTLADDAAAPAAADKEMQAVATPGLPADIAATAQSPADQLGSQAHQPILTFKETPPVVESIATSAAPVVAADPNRKIIKDATLTIEVDDVGASLGRIETIAAQSGGYVLETSTDQGVDSGRAGATVKFAVPVDQFEAALGRLRAIGTVANEQSSGVDVTTEFTDLQSRIANLEATQARVREFLAQAKTVEEALQVNARLTEIEGQLAELKGRSTYLAGRAAYSTVTVSLVGPALPTRTPTITPTPAPTATPTPGPSWSPAPVARVAFGTVRGLLQRLAELAIWLVVVVLPLALIAAAAWWGVRGLAAAMSRRRDR